MAEDPTQLTCLLACHQTPLRKTLLERGRGDDTSAEESPLHTGVWHSPGDSATGGRAGLMTRGTRPGDTGHRAHAAGKGLSPGDARASPWINKTQMLKSTNPTGKPTLSLKSKCQQSRNSANLFYFWLAALNQDNSVYPFCPCVWVSLCHSRGLLQWTGLKCYCDSFCSHWHVNSPSFFFFFLREHDLNHETGRSETVLRKVKERSNSEPKMLTTGYFSTLVHFVQLCTSYCQRIFFLHLFNKFIYSLPILATDWAEILTHFQNETNTTTNG